MKTVIRTVIGQDILAGYLVVRTNDRRQKQKKSFFGRVKITEPRERQHEGMHARLFRAIKKVEYWKRLKTQITAKIEKVPIPIPTEYVGLYEVLNCRLTRLKIRLNKWTIQRDYMFAICEYEADYKLKVD